MEQIRIVKGFANDPTTYVLERAATGSIVGMDGYQDQPCEFDSAAEARAYIKRTGYEEVK